ncbi:PAS domain S-box-containing protein [Flexibacter flexilis DSM 6793]|uniref:histidine kinase n=1 Tax=Flexibacter flexilis DSM 6793 TaxID=927664 RepID=A0A1I1ISP7_9BACT|nr:PAS domain S-box protein [Flexibacter flexilis]SFC39297.1 PAS domain S-box-containing protein [Flexibacter flexilis DSM 6793]
MAKAKILIVEDQPLLAQDLRIKLTNMGHQVLEVVSSGQAALRAILNEKPNIVLMDIMLEGDMDGIEAAKRIRNYINVPIIYLTSCADDETFDRANAIGTYAYLLKPVQERELDLCIRTTCQRHQLEQDLVETQSRYRSLFENTKEAIIIFDDAGKIIDQNQASKQLYYALFGDQLATHLKDFLGEGKDKIFGEHFHVFLDHQEKEGRIWVFSADKKTSKCLEYNAKANFLPQLNLVVLRDITESVMAQREIENLARFPSEAPNPVLRVSCEGDILYANKAANVLLEEWTTTVGGRMPDNLLGRVGELSEKEPQSQMMLVIGGKIYSLLFVFVEKGSYVNIYANDISQQKYSERIVNYQKDILEMIARNATLSHILEQICVRVQYFLTGSAAAIFYFDSLNRSLKLAATTRLPYDLAHLIEQETLPEKKNSPWAAAISEQEDIIIENLQTDPLATPYRELTQKYGYMSCWIKPVQAQDGEVVACFLMFYKQALRPSTTDINLINMAANLVGVAIERDFIFQSLHKQSLAFENINDAIFLTDTSGVITEWSPSAERVFGRRKNEIVGLTIKDTNLFEFTEGFEEFLTKDTLSRWSGELQYYSLLGEDGIVQLSIIRLLDIQDEYMGMLCVARDITQEKNVEIALKYSEANLKAIFDNTVQSFILINDKFEIAAFNRTARQISYALTGDFLQVGEPIVNYWYTEDKETLQDIMRRTMDGEYISYEEYITTRTGDSYWLEINFLPIYDSAKNITSICFTTLDIQDRKNTELALAESEARFRSLVQNSSDVIVIVSAKGYITYTSESAGRFLGYNPQDLLDNNLLDFVHPDDRDYVEVLIQNLADGMNATPPIEYRFLHQMGKYIHLESVCTNMLDEASVRGIVINSRDVEERKNSEETLKNIVRGVSDATGTDFFTSLVENMATYLNVSHVLISELVEERHSLRTLAYIKNSNIQPNFIYKAEHTPCADTLQQQMYYVEDNLQFLYPQDQWLLDENLETYLGIRLNNSKGEAIGLLCILDSKPFQNHDLAGSMLKIFSVRAAAELERIYTTDALIESQANLLSLIENTIDNIWAIDESYKLIAFNTAFSRDFEKYFGHQLTHGDVIINYCKGEWEGYYTRALSGEQFFVEIDQIYDEEIQNIEVYFNPISDEQGHVSGVSIFSRDITQRKQAENALRESEVNLVALIENTDDIIFSINANYQILAANSAFRRLHNLMFSRIIKPGVDFVHSLPTAYGQVWQEGFDKAKKGERVRQEIHYAHPKFPVHLEVSLNPIYSKGGMISGISIFARDITLRKQAENELKRTNFELDSFVYRASHDLRAPLRSVLGLINLLRIEESSQQREVYLGLMEKSINKLDTFISDLTHFSRNSRLSLNIEKVDFNAIIQDSLGNLRFMENAEKLAVELKIDQNVDFYSDISRISIVLQNLISNSIKYQRRDAGAMVTIEVKTSEFAATIIVEDNGKGIEEVYLERIFDMFFRASEESYGSGLGLYITKQVIEKLEGSVRVESEIGVGTTFIIKIPNLKSQIKILS